MLSLQNLHDYQLRMIDLAKQKPSVGLFMEMGLGKTTTTLSIIKEAKLPTLIVAPKLIAETVWLQEAKKWEHLKDLKISLISGSPTERWRALNNPTDIMVIGIDNFPWLVDVLPKWPFKMLVLDESSRWKDPSTKRFKALKKVVRLHERRIILTGTPTPNSIGDLWAQVAILDLGERLGKTLTSFRNEYMYPASFRGHVVFKWEAKPGAQKIIENKIQDICFSLRAQDYLNMPDKRTVDHTIPWACRTPYDKMRKDMVLEVGEDTLTAATAAVLANKLRQITAGAVYTEDGQYTKINECKVHFLQDLLENNNDNRIIFYHYKHSLAELKLAFPDAYEYSPNILDDWRDGKIKTLLLHPQSSGLGLNLQCNTGNLVQILWYDLPWSSELYLQANARVFRQGQEKPVVIHHLMMENSIDQRVLSVLQGKINLQEAILGAISL